MLTIYLMLVSLTTFFGFLFTPVDAVARANLVVSVLSLCLLAVVGIRAIFSYLVHAVTALTALLAIYTAMQMGGINSTAVIWLNVLSVPVLLMLGRTATLVWIAIMLMSILGLTGITWMGSVGSRVEASSSVVTWAFLNHVLALLNLMMGVRIYEYLHNGQLQKLKLRNEELEATHAALIRAQAHKDEFVAAVGHELRTPMNVILGFNGVLQRELSDQPEKLAVVGHIRRSTEHLLQLVNDILDFSELQAGELHLNRVDFVLKSLLDELQQRHGEKAKAKGITLRVSLAAALPLRVHGDRQRLLQILSNLVDNAIKFTDHGAVHVGVMAQGERLIFEVQDSGRGIPLERQAHIFRRFEHADVHTNRAYGGTGLGLTLCEKLVALHGGHIGVDSHEGRGACFWFDIPLQEAQESDPDGRLDDDGLANEPLRILVVDDNKVNLLVAQLQLQKCWPNASITTADSGAKVLTLLEQQVFDVALIDMFMPDMDGAQVAQQIRQHFPAMANRMPILALTANTNPVDRGRCLAAGMQEVLHKPMDTVALMAAVGRHVSRARRGPL
ncbi:ATP-binding protein [Limnohabitans sp. Rim8]|uniref:ATP-binding response regulator n=1 Tax=Limnohabitans sp. Rim8 TaxID=1100718 RepID=UPI002608FB00|nr:ATP-binding protein [Limnohabitans sp. Rim8]